MTKEEVLDYQKRYPLYHSMIRCLYARCPIHYDYDNCSFKEYGMTCRTCIYYNPVLILCELNDKEKIRTLSIPMAVLLDDCKTFVDVSSEIKWRVF